MATEGIGVVITLNGVTEVFIKGEAGEAKEYYELYEDIKPYLEELDKKIVKRVNQIQNIKKNINLVVEELITPPEEKYW
ncbi:MAG: hypothetical protein ACYC56_07895 [Candidatus Aquicultor sp.]